MSVVGFMFEVQHNAEIELEYHFRNQPSQPFNDHLQDAIVP